ncbi:MAG: hypothetical protein OXC64_02125 [Flavobacteriaceae bacterium]|nr:hypothetical protein [Flavobacteriaceae bacterium]
MQDILASQFSKNIHFGCELFPKISDDRKKAATFYTQDSTAEFLSRLVITENDLDDHQWKDEEIFKTLKIADLACGIGTLLRAGFRRAMAIRNKFLKQHEGYQSDEE